MGACNTLPGDLRYIKDIPGIEIENGEDAYNKTTYLDAKLPEAEFGRNEMIELLTLVAKQKGKHIDDELFVDKLHANLFHCDERFMLDDPRYEDGKRWEWSSMYDGAPTKGTIMLNEDGTYYHRNELGCAFVGDPAADSMHNDGYHGYHTQNEWSYDATSHTLTTYIDSSTEPLTAEVLYFDGEKAVMLGHIDGIASLGYNRYNNHEGGICHRLELYLIEFPDREEFFEKMVSLEEYNALYEQYIAEGGEEIHH
jgi:hypothetical protein